MLILEAALVFAAASVAAHCAPAEPTALAYQWVKGQAVVYHVTQESAQKIAGLPMGDANQSLHEAATLRLTPTGVADDGAATIEVVYTALSVEMQALMQPTRFAYDSGAPGADDAHNPLAGPVKAIVGQTFTVVLAPDGAVKKLDGVQPIADAMAKAGAGSSSPAVGQLLRGVFSEQAVTNLFENAFHRLPPGPVEVGGGWDTTYEMPDTQMGRMKAAGRSTLTSLDAGIATIDTAGTISLEPPGTGKPVNPMMRNMTLGDAKGQSTAVFDAGRGLLRRYSGKVSIPVSSSTPAREGGPGMSISISIDNSTAVELSEAK